MSVSLVYSLQEYYAGDGSLSEFRNVIISSSVISNLCDSLVLNFFYVVYCHLYD